MFARRDGTEVRGLRKVMDMFVRGGTEVRGLRKVMGKVMDMFARGGTEVRGLRRVMDTFVRSENPVWVP
jgi:hypothetical protein